MLKILIVDDHALFREGLHYVLDKLEEQVVILEAADFGRAMKQLVDNPDLDLVLLDLNMSDTDGFTALDSMSKNHSTVPVVILSTSNQQDHVRRALASGALGYIPKDSANTVMQQALRLVLSGGIYVPPTMASDKNKMLLTS